MGKVEILTLIAGVVLSIALAIILVPTFTKGSDIAKISLINSDINAIRKAGNTFVENLSQNGNFEGIEPANIQPLIPALKIVGGKFVSTANDNITYSISSNSPYNILILEIDGLESIDGAEDSLINSNKGNTSNNIEADVVRDGILILNYKG